MTGVTFRQNVAFWLASHALPPDLLGHQRLVLPLKNRDPIWVIEELRRVGGQEYWKLSADEAKLELLLLTRGT